MNLQNPVFIPGPTNIPDRLRKACDMPTIDHRSPLFGQILAPAREGARAVFKSTEAEIVLLPGTGTAGWETAITNTLSPGDAVLAGRNGLFSHRWIDMCQRHGLEVKVIDFPWGQGLDAAAYQDVLAADTSHRIKAILATHNETATGVTSDIAAFRRALDDTSHPALLLVDGVSSIASIDFRFDEWGIDVAVAGSQKGFMLPPGLAIVGFSPRAMAATRSAGLARTYFDVADMVAAYGTGSYPYTPPVGLINGLTESSAMLLEEGLDQVFARHHRIAEGVRAAVGAWGLGLCAAAPALFSDTVSAIRVPEGFDAGRIVSHAASTYGVAFGAGLGEVAGKVFRIGHLGSMTDVMALSGIATAEMCMADLGLGIRLGSGVAAAQEYYRQNPARPERKAA